MLSEVFTVGNRLLSEDSFFETGGFTPWGPQQTPVPLVSPNEHEPVFSFSSSDNSTPKTETFDVDVMDDRKRRRKISNRESARRSRMRKQKHLENMRSQLNRLKTGNRDLMNRLRAVNLHGQLVWQENQRLVSESVMLEQRLRDIRHALNLRLLCDPLLPSA